MESLLPMCQTAAVGSSGVRLLGGEGGGGGCAGQEGRSCGAPCRTAPAPRAALRSQNCLSQPPEEPRTTRNCHGHALPACPAGGPRSARCLLTGAPQNPWPSSCPACSGSLPGALDKPLPLCARVRWPQDVAGTGASWGARAARGAGGDLGTRPLLHHAQVFLVPLQAGHAAAWGRAVRGAPGDPVPSPLSPQSSTAGNRGALLTPPCSAMSPA